jgi:hypothetical protein
MRVSDDLLQQAASSAWRRGYPMDRVLLRTLVSASKNLFLFSSSAQPLEASRLKFLFVIP